jgi:GNAT superfamily N-acetyltransferase
MESLVLLFDGYRQFYGQASDVAGARCFLRERFEHQQSILFVAVEDEKAVGFAQLYPSFSSVGLSRLFILNDLFVAPEERGGGVGRALLEAACSYGRAVGAARLCLSTAVTNAAAQALYESAGWTRDAEFFNYDFPLG